MTKEEGIEKRHFEAYIKRQVLLERYKASKSKKIKAYYKRIYDLISEKVFALELDNPNIAVNLQKTLSKLFKPFKIDTSELIDFANDEARWTFLTMESAVGFGIATQVSPVIIEKIANSTISGRVMKEWFGEHKRDLIFKVETAVKDTVISGGSTRELRDILKGIFSIKNNHATTVALTGIATINNNVRAEIYRENRGLIDFYQQLSTLDFRTSSTCKARSGLKWYASNYKPYRHKYPYRNPPLHMRCRSILIPMFKNIEDDGEQSSLKGYVSAKMNYGEWLKKYATKDEVYESLGKFKGDLFLANKLQMTDLVDFNGRELTIKELKAKMSI